MKDNSPIDALTYNPRYVLGALCVASAWLFPFSSGLAKDALQQIFSVGVFSAAAFLFGMSSIPLKLNRIIISIIILLLIIPSTYLGGRIAGIAGLLILGVACHVGAHLKQRPTALSWLLMAIVASAVVNASEGLLQWLGLSNSLWPWVVEPERRGIAFGTFRQPNLFATFLCVGSVCVIWLVQMRRLTESMAFVLLFFLVTAVVASGSRTGAIEVMLLAAAGLVWRHQQKLAVTRLMLGSPFIFGLATLVLPLVAELHGFGFTSSAERLAKTGQESRFTLWSNALDLIREQPLLGWGWLETGYGHYVSIFEHRFSELVSHTHNLLLQVAIEFGLPVAALLTSLALGAVYLGQPWRVTQEQETEPREDRQFAWAILLFIVGIHSMLELPLWSSVGFLFLTGLAIGYLLPTLPPKQPGTHFKPRPYFAELSSAGLLIFAVLAWQQYAKVLIFGQVKFNDRNAQLAALSAASDAFLFRGYLDFAELRLAKVLPENAEHVRKKAEKLLHFSAEPKVIEPLLLSLWHLGDTAAFRFHAERFCYAFPSAFGHWLNNHVDHPMLTIITSQEATSRLRQCMQKTYN